MGGFSLGLRFGLQRQGSGDGGAPIPEASAGSAAGISTAAAIGRAIALAIASAAGVAAAAGVGLAIVTATGAASGVAAAPGIGQATNLASGAAAGTGAAAGVGGAITAGAGAAAGVGGASGVGAMILAAAGSSAGVAAASAVGANANATWHTVASSNPTVNGVGFGSVTTRQTIAAANLSNIGGAKIRITLKAGSTGGFITDACYIGHAAASGDAYDFESTPTQVTFGGGNAGATVAINTTVLSDEITFTLQNSKALVVAIHFGTSGVIARASSQTGWQAYNKSANDASTVDATGYTTSNVVNCLTLVEAYF
jgi:hypothetical protein